MGMKTSRKTILLVALCLLLIVAGAIASASSDLVDSLSIPWWTADGGGQQQRRPVCPARHSRAIRRRPRIRRRFFTGRRLLGGLPL